LSWSDEFADPVELSNDRKLEPSDGSSLPMAFALQQRCEAARPCFRIVANQNYAGRNRASLTARQTGAEMTDLEILDRNIIELKSWLNAAWRHLAKSSLTKFERGELRNEMKQCNTELRRCLELVRAERAKRRRQSSSDTRSAVVKVDFRLIGQNPPV
jgi:hypothetical protein